VPDYARVYAHQEYLTPGAAETVRRLAEAARPDESSWLLDVGAGKGEAAAHLAGEFACHVMAVEPYDPFVHYGAAKFWHFNLRDLVTLVRASGRRLPVRDEAFDAAYCIGGPSIVGLDDALREMARAVRRGGWVVVSDAVWRSKPDAPLGPEWGWVAEMEPKLTLDEYAARLRAVGLDVAQTVVHPREAWEEYWAPMQAVAQEAKTAQPADIFFADEVESDLSLERRAVDKYLDYATLVGCKRDAQEK
jgi:ubiquinone/menaquinone biosynthesis C-methylase UbiE